MGKLSLIDSGERTYKPRTEAFDSKRSFGEMLQISQGNDIEPSYRPQNNGFVQITKKEASILIKILKDFIEPKGDLLDLGLESFQNDLSWRVVHNLKFHLNINTIRDLISYKERDIRRVKNIGRSSIKKIRQFLIERGLAYSDGLFNCNY